MTPLKNFDFEEAIIELLKLRKEVPRHTLVVLGRLSGLSEKEAKRKIGAMLKYGTIYVSRREDIIKLT